MKKNPWDKYYNNAKELRINAIYADTLCELILLRYEYVYDNISKADVLKELPGIRELIPIQVKTIYEIAIKLFELKYDVIVLQDNPFVFKK